MILTPPLTLPNKPQGHAAQNDEQQLERRRHAQDVVPVRPVRPTKQDEPEPQYVEQQPQKYLCVALFADQDQPAREQQAPPQV